MRTDPVLGPKELDAYHAHLQSDHDYRIRVEVLTMEENPTGIQMDLIDGQVNVAKQDEGGPVRTASLLLSDPSSATQYGTLFMKDNEGVLWVNRILRVTHETTVPTLGEVRAVAMVGVPTGVSQKGAEIALELSDKSILMNNGVRAKTFTKGTSVSAALKALAEMCGEKHTRIPFITTDSGKAKRLSAPYSVGMGENSLTPWACFKKIASREANHRVFYSCDGYLTVVPSNASVTTVAVTEVLDLPDQSTTFTDFSNYAKVTSKRKPTSKQKKAKPQIIEYIYESVALLDARHELSEESLARHEKGRTLPLVVSDNSRINTKQTAQRAKEALMDDAVLNVTQAYELIPFFHLDEGDRFGLPDGIGAGSIPFDQCSIPLGVGGNMSVGAVKWVSRPAKITRVKSRSDVKRKKKRGGGKN